LAHHPRIHNVVAPWRIRRKERARHLCGGLPAAGGRCCQRRARESRWQKCGTCTGKNELAAMGAHAQFDHVVLVRCFWQKFRYQSKSIPTCWRRPLRHQIPHRYRPGQIALLADRLHFLRRRIFLSLFTAIQRLELPSRSLCFFAISSQGKSRLSANDLASRTTFTAIDVERVRHYPVISNKTPNKTHFYQIFKVKLLNGCNWA
jgi:hypothetical protein